MKVPKAMLLEQVMNESSNDPEIIVIRNALLTNKWESELVKPYKNESCENNNVILRRESIYYQSLCISKL